MTEKKATMTQTAFAADDLRVSNWVQAQISGVI